MNKRKSPLDDYRTINEAAEFLRCSRSTVYALHDQGKLELVKHGGRTFVSEASLLAVANDVKPMPRRPI